MMHENITKMKRTSKMKSLSGYKWLVVSHGILDYPVSASLEMVIEAKMTLLRFQRCKNNTKT